jgi:hypothetical protein
MANKNATLPFVQKILAAAPKPKLVNPDICTERTSCKCSLCEKKNSYPMRKLELLSKDILSSKRLRESEDELNKPTMVDILEFLFPDPSSKKQRRTEVLVK